MLKNHIHLLRAYVLLSLTIAVSSLTGVSRSTKPVVAWGNRNNSGSLPSTILHQSTQTFVGGYTQSLSPVCTPTGKTSSWQEKVTAASVELDNALKEKLKTSFIQTINIDYDPETFDIEKEMKTMRFNIAEELKERYSKLNVNIDKKYEGLLVVTIVLMA
mmetsp:Transcript_25821/g.40038  ORF Transcript_25821/g.40038 Transcript_25821/m.40038 type:complete len:160 (-) Transcript_25821:361-840(-)